VHISAKCTECTVEDVTQFQRHLDTLVTWSHKWQLHISSKKCNLLYCGAVDDPDMSIDGSVICKLIVCVTS